jgi:hypothetical protein
MEQIGEEDTMATWLRRTKMSMLVLVIAVGSAGGGLLVACGGAYPDKAEKRQELRERAKQNMGDLDSKVKKSEKKE